MKYTPGLLRGSKRATRVPQKGTQGTKANCAEFTLICAFCAFLWLAFGAFENGVADFDAVSDCKDARLLALPAIFHQHYPVRRKGLLHCPVIEEFAGIFDGSGAGSTFLILQPQHTKRLGTDIKAGLALLFVEEVNDVKLEAFLLILANERNRRAAFFVTQQGVDAVMMLRNETRRGVLSWRERRAVDNSPQFPVLKNQRVLH